MASNYRYLEKGLDFRRQRLLAWLCTPVDDREPSNQTQLAEELGVPKTRLSEWKKEADFLKAWEEMYLRTMGNPEVKMDIIRTLAKTATDADDPKHIQAARAYFEIEGTVKPANTQVTINDARGSLADMSDEELLKLQQVKAADELAQRREAG